MAKTALVISGGGSKGSFAVGALKYLVGELGLSFDVVAGTSTGALIAPMIAARGKDALDTLEKEYTSVTTRDILSGLPAVRVITGKPSLYDSDPLEKRIRRHITDDVFRALRDGPRQMAVTTVDLRDGKLVYYQTGPRIQTDEPVQQVATREQLVRAVHASASIPVAMPPVENSRDGHPDDGYVDGGVREYVPIEVAIDAGATDICCIILTPPFEKRPLYTKRFGSVVDVLTRTLDLLTEEIGASDVKLSNLYTRGRVYLDRARATLAREGVGEEVLRRAFDESGVPNPFEGKVAVSLRIIRPPSMLRGDTIKFDPDDMRWNLNFGYKCAKEQWPGTSSLYVPALFPEAPAAAPAGEPNVT